jgi:hypothetical protein
MKIGQMVRNLKFMRTCRTKMVNSRNFSAYYRKENGEMTEK